MHTALLHFMIIYKVIMGSSGSHLFCISIFKTVKLLYVYFVL